MRRLRDYGGLRLCAAHVKQLQRKGRLSALEERGWSPLELVIVTGSRMLEAGDDHREYELALQAFKDACRAWMKSLGWRPTEREAAVGADVAAALPGDLSRG
jgi:hypothetical protein